jgi:putative membrane protein
VGQARRGLRQVAPCEALISLDVPLRQSIGDRDVVEADPDARFTLANERTYLAWVRTSLAVIAGGLAIAQFLRGGVLGTAAAVGVGIALITVGAGLSMSSYRQWQRNDRALRRGGPLPRTVLPRLLIIAVVVTAALAVGLSAAVLVTR